jgi:peroxiredoxin
MSRTLSKMVPLGTAMPDFTLPSGDGQMYKAQAIRGEVGTLVIFICNHCPFVVHVANELAALGRDYHGEDLHIVAINSNDAEQYPDDAPEQMVTVAASWGLTYPYLYDQTQDVARAFEAACTPDFFLFDHGGQLVYRGQLDDSRPGNDLPVTGQDLRSAMDALLAGDAISTTQTPSMGCNIKWKTAAPCCNGDCT